MRKPSAFGKDTNYQTYVDLGRAIGSFRNNDELARQIKLFTGQNIVNSQRAASVLQHVSDVCPELFYKYVDELIYVLNHPIHDSGPRVALRILIKIDIPTERLGTIIDLAFNYLNNPTTPVAIKVNAMYVIANQIKDYPDLINE